MIRYFIQKAYKNQGSERGWRDAELHGFKTSTEALTFIYEDTLGYFDPDTMHLRIVKRYLEDTIIA